ncbi:putative helicase [Babesia sp. Xinjiang]|uniref:putative helicase n=1 Tax=Babesia sp. Xinjiang TaxID=462227 RepID=UPI000A23D947|nr:putative helicase [Babesia sp. Xinjiang]ORM42209.1 putative helicase [Babesia sp. Xinjiang]
MEDKYDIDRPATEAEMKYDTVVAVTDNKVASGRSKADDVQTPFQEGIDTLTTIDYGSLGILNVESAKKIRSDTKIPIKDRLRLWHAMCPTDFSNLLGSAGAKESCCLIHAESLIVHVVCSAEKEGNVLLDFAKGPQTLQLIYRVERILSGITRCGGTFQLVFFDVFKKIFDPGYHSGDITEEEAEDRQFFDGYMLLREVLLTHAALNEIPHLVFKDWYDTNWINYVNNSDPACILVEEGSSFLYKYKTVYEIVDTNAIADLNEQNAEIVAEFQTQQKYIDRFTFATHAMAIYSLSINLSVAYFFELGPFAHNFKAFISFPSNCTPPTTLLKEVETQFLAEYPRETETQPGTEVQENGGTDDNEEEVVATLIEELGAMGVQPRLRQLVACNYIKNLNDMKPGEDEEVDEDTALYIDSCVLTFKVLLIHNHLIDTLPLEDRCTRRLDAENWEFFSTYIAATLDFMASTTVPILMGMQKILYNMRHSKRDVADLFDGNLFTSILHCMAIYAKEHDNKVDGNFLALPEEVASGMDRLYAHFSGDSKAKLFPIDMTPFAECGIYDNVDAMELDGNNVGTKLLNIDNQFVNMYFGLNGARDNVEFYEGNNSHCMTRFAELQWRNPALMSEKTECIDYFLKVEKHDKYADMPKRTHRQEQRSMQRQNAFSHLLSRYLGSNNLHHPIVPKLEHTWLDVKQKALEDDTNAKASPEETVASKPGKPEKHTKDKHSKESKKEKAGKVKTSGKAEILRQKHAAAQESKSREGDMKALERLSGRMASMFSREHDFDVIYTNILDYTAGPNRAVDLTGDFKWLKNAITTKPIQLQFVKGMLENLLKTFEGYRMRSLNKRGARTSLRRTICITIRLIHDCFREFKSIIDGETIVLLQRFLIKLGMPKSAANLFDSWMKLTDDKKNKKFQLEKEEPFDYAIRKEMEFEFQLAYMGDLMERTLGSTEDPRVLFKPDAWQKMLLDIVDLRESALVVAPTSTGKTYICYYAMEQGLRLDDEGVVIYVSPNDALALQVTYEITARFSSKNYATPSCAAVLSASFLEKFHDPKWNCAQILVTVPSIVEQLLIAMRSSELGFAKRIEYLILDEIHCISDEDIGPFLERVVHLSASPFLALSATVGNPTHFHSWLSKVELTRRNSKTAKVHYIYFDERFSDLKLECYSSRHLVPLNPATCLSYHNVKANGFPKDFYLRPKDLMILCKATNFVMGNRCPDIDYLEPSEYFRNTPIITKRQYRYWLQTYITEFSRQVQNGVIGEKDFEKIMECLKSVNISVSPADITASSDDSQDAYFKLYPLLKPFEERPNAAESNATTQVVNTTSSSSQSREFLDPAEVLTLLNTLEQTKRLPCLAFTFDRNHMEHVLISVTQQLKRRQWEKYYGTPEATAWTNAENKRRIDHYQMLMRQYEAEKKMKGASREQKEEQGIGGKVEDFLELPKEPVDVAEDYDPEFNYYNRKIYVNYTEEVENFIKIASGSISNRKNVDLFVEAMRRGIGIHHEGLPHKFTMLTETLYRMGFLRVLLSGRSLAFGINVPCKSVVFMGDNYELTPLMYKQMSGRCGRRGFDLSGHVIFWGLPMKRIRQLLTAQLPNLSGYASCSPTEVLATLSAFNSLLVSVRARPPQPKNTGKISTTDARVRKNEIITRSRDIVVDPRVIVKRLASIFMHALNPQSGYNKDEVIVFRACVETLFNLGFIDRHGLVSGCCELALLTRDAHPSNLFLAHLAQMGKLHDLVKTSGSDAADKLMDLLARFAYKRKQLGTTVTLRRLLPQRVRCGVKYTSKLKSNLLVKDEGSLGVELLYPESFPLLPATSGEIRDVLRVYNENVLGVLSKYQAKLTPMDAKLPLSNVDFRCGPNQQKCWFMDKRMEMQFTSLSSPFVGINGLPGNFTTARELWLSSRACSDITLDMVPTIESVEIDVIQMDPHFNVIKKLAVALENSYIIDYWVHGRFSIVRDVNGLGQYAWFDLRKILVLLKLAKLTLKGYTDGGSRPDVLQDAVEQALDRFEGAFNRI